MPLHGPIDPAQIDSDRQLIEDELRRIVADQQTATGPLVFEGVEYAVFSGGKRLRPLLGLSIARAVGGDPCECLLPVLAVELLHCASLVIDDLPCMDNERFRRSRRATHVEFGEDIAILVAFALVLLSIRLTQRPVGRHTALSQSFQELLVDSVLRAGLIAGQEADIGGRHGLVAPTANVMKTAPLFELACAAGLVGSDLPPTVRAALLSFGRSYGDAFQAKDDLADGDVVDARLVETRLATCRGHLERVQAMGVHTDLLRPFVSWLRPDGVAVGGRGEPFA